MSINENINYEILYNELKTKYEQYQQDNEDIFKEYELTISLLTDSTNQIKEEKENLESKLSKIENDLKELQKEKEKLIIKNKEKILDIQSINKKYEKLLDENKLLKEEKNLYDTRIVKLENVNENYISKIRQDEAIIDDLNFKLESVLEDNIIIQTDFELYKQEIEKEIIKKDETIRELKESKNINIFKTPKGKNKDNGNNKENNKSKEKFLMTNDFKKIPISVLNKTTLKKNPEILFPSYIQNNINNNFYIRIESPIRNKETKTKGTTKSNNEMILKSLSEKKVNLIKTFNEMKIFDNLIVCEENNINFIPLKGELSIENDINNINKIIINNRAKIKRPGFFQKWFHYRNTLNDKYAQKLKAKKPDLYIELNNLNQNM